MNSRPVVISKHDRFNPQPKPEKVIKPKYDLKKETAKKKKPSGEGQLFEDIWKKRPHRSEISGDYISEPHAWNFLHVIRKANGFYPLFKLYPKNIIIGTKAEHDQWDSGCRSDLIKLPNWKKMFELEKELIEEYKLLTPKK